MAAPTEKTLSEKTRIAMSTPVWAAFIGLVFSAGGGFAVSNEKAKEAGAKADANKIEIQQLKADKVRERLEVISLIQEIRESQIRIEEKLNMKQDKYAK